MSLAAARHFGVSRKGVQAAAVKFRIPLGKEGRRHYDAQAREIAELRARWAALLPAKLKAIRRDMAVIMASGPE